MKRVLILLILLFLVACETQVNLVEGQGANESAGGSRTAANIDGVKLNSFEQEIFKLVNDHRQKLGKNQLKWHKQAIIESQDHSQDMASFRVPFGHAGFSARIERIKSHDNSIKASGENVAQNSTASRAFNAWLKSSGHRKNIEGNYTHTGIGAIKSANGSWYFTQIYLLK
jgi:uncharacterized protein YkwD